MQAIRYERCYLHGCSFIIHPDYEPPGYLNTQDKLNGRQVLRLKSLGLEIHHAGWTKNPVTKAISRDLKHVEFRVVVNRGTLARLLLKAAPRTKSKADNEIRKQRKQKETTQQWPARIMTRIQELAVAEDAEEGGIEEIQYGYAKLASSKMLKIP